LSPPSIAENNWFIALSQENEGFDSIKRFVRSLTNEMSHQPRETRAQKQSRTQDGDSTHPKMSSMLEAANKLEPTPLSGLFLDGMGTDQLWNQLELRAQGICELVNLVFEGEYPDPEALEKDSSQEEADEMEVDDDDDDEWIMEDEEMEEEEESSEDSILGEHIAPLSGSSFDPSSRVADVGNLDLDGPSNRANSKFGVPGKRKGPRHPTLDDDFFSISEFNREVDSAEAKSSSRGRLKDDSDEEESVDLFADVPEDLTDDSEEDDEGDGDTSKSDTLNPSCVSRPS
jgi:U3 small nucleolar RNA-associated protein MPP10